MDGWKQTNKQTKKVDHSFFCSFCTHAHTPIRSQIHPCSANTVMATLFALISAPTVGKNLHWFVTASSRKSTCFFFFLTPPKITWKKQKYGFTFKTVTTGEKKKLNIFKIPNFEISSRTLESKCMGLFGVSVCEAWLQLVKEVGGGKNLVFEVSKASMWCPERCSRGPAGKPKVNPERMHGDEAASPSTQTCWGQSFSVCGVLLHDVCVCVHYRQNENMLCAIQSTQQCKCACGVVIVCQPACSFVSLCDHSRMLAL